MKRYSLSCVLCHAFLAVVFFLMTSCITDYRDLSSPECVRFEITLASRPTRSNNGSVSNVVNHLYYWIYDVDENGSIGSVLDKGDVEAFAEGANAIVEVRLVPGVKYKALFFACDDNAVSYGVFSLSDAGSMDIDYTKMNAGVASDDAYYACKEFSVSENSQDIILKRPFAQLNIGSDDLDNPSVKYIGLQNFHTELEVESGIYSRLDMLTGTVSHELEKGDYMSWSDVSEDKNGNFPVSGYSQLQSHYFLCGDAGNEGQSLINATFNVYKRAESTPITSVNLASTPVKTNYRTNVTGSLLTGKTNIHINVEGIIGHGTDVEITDDTKTVRSSSEFLSALQEGGRIYVPSGENFTVILQNDGTTNDYCISLPNRVHLTLDGNVGITLPSGVYDNGKYIHFLVQNDLTIDGKGSLLVKGGNYFLDVSNSEASVRISDISMTSDAVTTGANRKAPAFIRSVESREINLTGLELSCCNSVVEIKNNESKANVVIENCSVIQPDSESTSSYNLFYLNNSKASGEMILNKVTAASYNTVVAVTSGTESGSAILIDCNFELLKQKAYSYLVKNLSQPSDRSLMYNVNIQGGKYYYKSGSSNSKYGIAGYEGNISIYGGYFNVKPYVYSYQGTDTELMLPAGYEWYATEESLYPYGVREIE